MANLAVGIALILIVFNSACSKLDTDKKNKRLLILAFVLLVLLAGCRNAEINLGTDLNNYYRLYARAIKANSWSSFVASSSMEYGYLAINWGLSRLIKWPQFILFFQAAVCCGLTLHFIYKHTKNTLMAVLGFMALGLFQFYLTGFRQSIAIALCLFSIEFAERKKPITFFGIVLAAITIHQTAIVFLPIYFLVNLKVSKLTAIIDIIVMLGVSRTVSSLINLGNDIFNKEYIEAFGGNSLGGIVNLLIGFFIVFTVLYTVNSQYTNSNRYTCGKYVSNVELPSCFDSYQLIHILIIGIGIYALRYQALVLERISLYFTPTMFVMLQDVIDSGYTKESKRVLNLVFMLGLLFLIYWRLSRLTYSTFWG